MVLSFAVCNVTFMPLRKEASHRAEQVSQLLFGERAEIMKIEQGTWAYIRCLFDDYEGWCKLSQLKVITKKEFNRSPRYIVSGHQSRLLFEEGELVLPAGADLFGLKKGKIAVNLSEGKWKGKKAAFNELAPEAEQLKQIAMSYLYAPYQWGGRGLSGIDCSGLTQMVMKQCGIKLLRDASQQVTQGETIAFLQEAKCGDLAFFDNAEGRIDHVGILLDSNHIIHATEVAGYVVIDKIDQQGIVSKIYRKRTHSLRMIKRLF